MDSQLTFENHKEHIIKTARQTMVGIIMKTSGYFELKSN